MGLNTTHGCWDGAYSAFHRWREKIAEVAGLPPLELMEGFFCAHDSKGGVPTIYLDPRADKLTRDGIERLEARLPIKWDILKPDPALYELLYHSDCDGELPAEICGPLADRLEQLLPLLPNGEAGGHIGNWRDKTKTFIDGLRDAASKNEPVGFY